MQIYLMRHGIAVTADAANASSDEERPLTPKGTKRTRQAVKGLTRLGPSIDKVLSSPLLRARQTADIVAEGLRLKDSVEQIPELAPGGDLAELLHRLATYKERAGVLLVGHQPSLGNVASLLLSGSKELQIDLKKSGICCITVDVFPAAGNGILKWMLAPKQLRNLARR
jgi:phosphohistidine phosphatase